MPEIQIHGMTFHILPWYYCPTKVWLKGWICRLRRSGHSFSAVFDTPGMLIERLVDGRKRLVRREYICTSCRRIAWQYLEPEATTQEYQVIS